MVLEARLKRPEQAAQAVAARIDKVLDGDGCEKDGTGDHGCDHVREAGDQHALTNEAEEQNGNYDADNRAIAAKYAHTAEHDHRDCRQQQHVAHIGPHRAVI